MPRAKRQDGDQRKSAILGQHSDSVANVLPEGSPLVGTSLHTIASVREIARDVPNFRRRARSGAKELR